MAYDVILIGGGLANTLLAWKLAVTRPALRLLLLEQGETLGGNHTWSFYHADLTADQHAFLKPAVAHQWAGYDVRFPAFSRELDTPYYSVTSDSLHTTVYPLLAEHIRLGTAVTDITGNTVRFDGQTVTAPLVIDGRGFRASRHMAYAYQKFLGLEVGLKKHHGQTRPIIMDASVLQEDGFRFVYTLPLSAERILIEDTYYSDDDRLDEARLVEKIHDYTAARGWEIDHVIRQEKGVLPITLDGDIDAFWADMPTMAVPSGLRAHLFHQTTGYSLLYALRVADRIASLPSLDQHSVRHAIERYSKQQWLHQRFYRLLNRMLFFAAQPATRYRLLKRFYTLARPLIDSFYAGRLTLWQKTRILSGKPPVPVTKALQALLTNVMKKDKA